MHHHFWSQQVCRIFHLRLLHLRTTLTLCVWCTSVHDAPQLLTTLLPTILPSNKCTMRLPCYSTVNVTTSRLRLLKLPAICSQKSHFYASRACVLSSRCLEAHLPLLESHSENPWLPTLWSYAFPECNPGWRPHLPSLFILELHQWHTQDPSEQPILVFLSTRVVPNLISPCIWSFYVQLNSS